jgi:hypothetical protein
VDGLGREHTCNPGDPLFSRLENWLPLLSYYGFEQPANDWLTFDFQRRRAGCVRIFGAELSQDDYGSRYMQLGQIEVYP